MSYFKDIFISYGRRESLGFVARLQQKLKLAGYDAWFDKVNIPDGEDYAARINHGIESAHNFVYVMAPRSLCSPYCLIELEYARVLGKRVIPINQMVIFSADEGELSVADQQVLRGFYAFHGLPDPCIKTVQQVLTRSLQVVGRTDWLDSKERLDEEACNKLAAWAQSYENHWHKHEDLAYLQTLEIPLFGETIDTLESVVERIELVLQRYQAYVAAHTEILAQALLWHKNQRATRYLLVGKERYAGQDWLLKAFQDGEQAPCEPGHLVCEFICEARKNGENMLTDAFVCYDVEDRPQRDAVVRALSRHAITTWQHDRDIRSGATSEQAILDGIAGATNLLYFISPRSVASQYCQIELDYALSLNKRIIPILLQATSPLPDAVRELQYIEFQAENAIDQVLSGLAHERSYYEHHKILLTRALKWQAEAQRPSFLLRGHNLENAKIWLRLNQNRNQHPPTALHTDFIQHSEALKGQLGTDVFISYSRKDGDFARQLNSKLQEASKTTWFDQESIASGVDFESELYKGISSANNFVFILSPDAVLSQYCEREVDYAHEQGKRILSVLAREIDAHSLPKKLRLINWIDFTTKPFADSFAELVQELELDREHVQRHTELQQRALDWSKHQKSKDFLLNNSACENAEIWHDTAVSSHKQPAPTALQTGFINDSRRAIRQANRRKNAMLAWAMAGMVISVMLAVVAVQKMLEADEQRKQAQVNEIYAKAAVSEANFSLQAHFDGLLQGLDAAQRLQSLGALEAATEIQLSHKVINGLQKNLYQIKERQRLQIETNKSYWVEFNTKMNRILIPLDKNYELYDFNGKHLKTLSHPQGLKLARFIENSSFIEGFSQDDKSYQLWNSEGQLIHTLTDEQGFKSNLYNNSSLYNPIKNYLALQTRDKKLRLFDLNNQSFIATPAALNLVDEKWGNIVDFEFSLDADYLVSLTQDKQLQAWHLPTQAVINMTSEAVNSYALSQRAHIAAGVTDNASRLWTLQGELIATLATTSPIKKIAFNPQAQPENYQETDTKEVLATLNADKQIQLWTNQGKLLTTLEHPDGFKFEQLRFSPQGRLLQTSTQNLEQQLWDLDGNLLFKRPMEYYGAYQETVFSAQENLIAVKTDEKNSVEIWNNQGGYLATLKGHEAPIQKIIFHPTNSHIATGGQDNLIKIWNANGRLYTTLKGHHDWVMGLAFDSQGEILASASDDLSVRLWHKNPRLNLFNADDSVIYNQNTMQQEHGELEFSTPSGYAESFVTLSTEEGAYIWQSDGQILRHLVEVEDQNLHAKYSFTGAFFLTQRKFKSNLSAPVQLWRSRDGKLIKTLISEVAEHARVDSFFIAGDEYLITRIHSPFSAGPVQLWRTEDGALIKTLLPQLSGEDVEIDIRQAANSAVFVTTIEQKNRLGPVQLWQIEGSSTNLLEAIEYTHPDYVSVDVNMSLSGERITTAVITKDSYGPLQLWTKEGVLLKTLQAIQPKSAQSMQSPTVLFNEKAQIILTALHEINSKKSSIGPVQLSDFNGQAIATIMDKQFYDELITPFYRFSPNGEQLLFIIPNSFAQLWQTDGSLLTTLLELEEVAKYASSVFSRDSQHLVVFMDEKKQAALWNSTTHTVKRFNKQAEIMYFNPPANVLIVHNGKTVELLTLDLEPIASLTHQSDVSLLAFSADQQWIASGGYDNKVKLWKADGTYLATLEGHKATIENIYFSANNEMLLTRDDNNTIIRWQLKGINELKSLQAMGCDWMADYFASAFATTEQKQVCDTSRRMR